MNVESISDVDDRHSGNISHVSTHLLSPAERENIAAEMLEFLRRHIINVWFPRCIDRQAGGFFCDFDRAWKPCGPQQRMLEFQARQTHVAALLALAFPNESQWTDTAIHGFRYLRDVMWDHQHGGWYWMIGRDGVVLQNGSKHAHSTAYALQACVQVHLATREPGALELAREGFEWFDRYGYDNEYGGFQSWLRREGTILQIDDTSAAEPLGHDVGLKDVNVHGDWIEALTDLVRVQPNGTVQRRLQNLAHLFLTHLVMRDGALHYACYKDWRPQPALERYGYHFQNVHRFVTGSDLFERPKAFQSAARRLLDHAIARSNAGKSGGFWYAGPGGVPNKLENVLVLVKRRTWWPQFEALRSLALFSLRKNETDSRYAELFRTQWNFVRDRMCDKSFGGTYATCPSDLSARERPLGRWRNGAALHKGNVWKDASHDTDSLIDCIRLLRGKSHGPLLA
ncbi:MAG: hypothetical protein DME50_13480 [Verrucomicrobia bacterium]|nr:MAG: hypothetical protein DME50_13480 [Verrucomicrobiota bacterium]